MIIVEEGGGVATFKLARTILGRPLYFTAAYLIDGLLIDTGCAHTADELLDALSARRVDLIINTHSHEDHMAGNRAVQAAFGVDVLAHREALAYLENPSIRRHRLYQRVMWGVPEPCRAKPVGDEVRTKHLRFQVIHTPGHCRDHISLYEPEGGRVFSGDIYIGGRDVALRLDYNIRDIIESLKKLAGLDAKILYPGSGNARRNPTPELQGKIDYLEEVGERVMELHRQGLSYRRIRSELFGRETAIAYYTLGHFTGRNLVRSYIEERAGAPPRYG